FVGELLLALVAAPIVQFNDSITDADLPKYGLAEPARRILLRGKSANGGTNTPLVELLLGDVKEGLAYVRRADENPVYAIGLKDYERLTKAPWQLRARQVWRFSETNVVRVTVQYGEHLIDVRRL